MTVDLNKDGVEVRLQRLRYRRRCVCATLPTVDAPQDMTCRVVQAEEHLGGLFAITEGGVAEGVLDGHEEGTASEDLLSGEHALPLSI